MFEKYCAYICEAYLTCVLQIKLGECQCVSVYVCVSVCVSEYVCVVSVTLDIETTDDGN